jgi:hypothetical protein
MAELFFYEYTLMKKRTVSYISVRALWFLTAMLCKMQIISSKRYVCWNIFIFCGQLVQMNCVLYAYMHTRLRVPMQLTLAVISPFKLSLLNPILYLGN